MKRPLIPLGSRVSLNLETGPAEGTTRSYVQTIPFCKPKRWAMHATTMKLVTVHVDGEDKPRPIAVERVQW